MSRAKVKIDIDLLYKLAQRPLTFTVCCEILDVCPETVRKRKDAMAAFRSGRAKCKQLIGQNLMNLSKDNASVAIFLGKSVLGLRDDGVMDDETPDARLVIDETEPIEGGA